MGVDPESLAGLGLAPGTWWTAWSDGVTCERIVTTFEVAAPAEVEP